MARDIRILLSDKQALRFDEIVNASVGNKTFVKGELIEFALNKFHKKLCKPSDILAKLNSKENE